MSQCIELQIGLGVKMELSGIPDKSFGVWVGIDLFVSKGSMNKPLTTKNLNLKSGATGSKWILSRAG